MNTELLLDEKTLTQMSSDQLREYAEKKSKYILSKIEAAGEKIQKAKDAAEFAKNDDNFHWWNKQSKKIDAHSDALVCINEAIAELNNLVRESIDFSCTTPAFAQIMTENLDKMLKEGFLDSNGELVKLSEDSEMQAGYILIQTKLFTQQQKKYQHEQSIQDEEISSLKTELVHKTKIDRIQDSRLVELEKGMTEKEKIYAEQTQRMLKLRQMLAQKDAVDSLQEQNINANRDAILQNAEAIKLLMDFVKQKDALDNETNFRIRTLEEQLKFCSEQSVNDKSNLPVVALIISVVSFILAIVSLIIG